MAERQLEKFFLPGNAAILRPVQPGQEAKRANESAVDLQDALCELTKKLGLKARKQLEVWARTEHVPLVADRVVEFLSTCNSVTLASLTATERQTLYNKVKALQ